jgi:hypothetical protein
MTDENTTALQTMETPAASLMPLNTDTVAYLDPGTFNQVWRVAQALSKSSLVPAHFSGKPENCFIICQMALRLGVDPFMALSHTFVISGRAGLDAQFAIALAAKSKIFKGPIRFSSKGKGDDLEVTATAMAQDDQPVSSTVSMVMAKDEGWTKNSKYRSMPEHMLRYRAATFLIRQCAPEVLLGMTTVEELDDAQAAKTRTYEDVLRARGTWSQADAEIPFEPQKRISESKPKKSSLKAAATAEPIRDQETASGKEPPTTEAAAVPPPAETKTVLVDDECAQAHHVVDALLGSPLLDPAVRAALQGAKTKKIFKGDADWFPLSAKSGRADAADLIKARIAERADLIVG